MPCGGPSDVPHVMHTKVPATVIVLGVESNERHVMPPHFSRQGFWVNAATYVEVWESVVKPWIDSSESPYVSQQDSKISGTTSYVMCRGQFMSAQTIFLHIKP